MRIATLLYIVLRQDAHADSSDVLGSSLIGSFGHATVVKHGDYAGIPQTIDSFLFFLEKRHSLSFEET